jgi:hypothetical protein
VEWRQRRQRLATSLKRLIFSGLLDPGQDGPPSTSPPDRNAGASKPRKRCSGRVCPHTLVLFLSSTRTTCRLYWGYSTCVKRSDSDWDRSSKPNDCAGLVRFVTGLIEKQTTLFSTLWKIRSGSQTTRPWIRHQVTSITHCSPDAELSPVRADSSGPSRSTYAHFLRAMPH